MANKNTKRIRASFVKNGEFNELVPASGFHNDSKGAWQPRRMVAVKYVAKRKSKSFPKVNDGPTLSEQKKQFHPWPKSV